MPKRNSDEIALAVLVSKIDRLQSDVEKCVRKDEILPLQALVYGFAGLIFIAFIGAVIALVIVHPSSTIQSTPISQIK